MKKINFLYGIIAMVLAVAACNYIEVDTSIIGEDGLTQNATLVDIEDHWLPAGGAEEECAQAGGCENGFGYKVDGAAPNGTYFYGGASITISNTTGYKFDWSISSGYKVCAVIVKAGRGAAVYHYSGSVSSDFGLIAPDGKEISHVTFCFAECEEVCKDAFAIKTVTSYAKCFSNLSLTGYTPSGLLGWTNGDLWPDIYTFNLYAGGIDCASFGTLVGKIYVDYRNGSDAVVSIEMISPYYLDAVNAYIGSGLLPKDSDGNYTDNPNLYPVQVNLTKATSYRFSVSNLNDNVWVIVHATVCGF